MEEWKTLSLNSDNTGEQTNNRNEEKEEDRVIITKGSTQKLTEREEECDRKMTENERCSVHT